MEVNLQGVWHLWTCSDLWGSVKTQCWELLLWNSSQDCCPSSSLCQPVFQELSMKDFTSYSWDLTSVQFSSVIQLCLTFCNPMNHSMPGLPVHHQLPEFTQTHIHQASDAIQPSHPMSSPSPPAPNPSQHQRDSNDFANESTLRMRWPKYWSFSFSIIPSKQIPGLPSFRMDWLDLLA